MIMPVFSNSLFYLAKSGVHWLKKDASNQPVLRSNEILLLKVIKATIVTVHYFELYI